MTLTPSQKEQLLQQYGVMKRIVKEEKISRLKSDLTAYTQRLKDTKSPFFKAVYTQALKLIKTALKEKMARPVVIKKKVVVKRLTKIEKLLKYSSIANFEAVIGISPAEYKDRKETERKYELSGRTDIGPNEIRRYQDITEKLKRHNAKLRKQKSTTKNRVVKRRTK